MENPSINSPRAWQQDNLAFTELIRQQYNNCCFSVGTVEGDPIDTHYLKLDKPGTKTILLLLRPDELAAIAWCATGALWSVEIERVPKETAPAEKGINFE